MPDNAGFSIKTEEPAFWVDRDDDGWDEADIPPRPWIVPGFLMRGVLTLVIGAPVVGKSVLGLLWATALALGEDHGRFRTGGTQRRVVVLNAEDARDEQRRRLAGLLRQFGRKPVDLGGRLIRIGPTQTATLFMKDAAGEVHGTDAFAELKKLITTSGAEVVVLDPLVELTAGVDENSNSDMSQVAAKLRALAADTKTAIVIIHHARKGAVAPGDLDASRGASAVGGAVRGGFTLTGMTEADATALGINLEQRKHFIRLDDAKPSYTPAAAATWYERLNIDLANGDGAPTLLPWAPPKDAITTESITAVERGIALGSPEGPWSPTLSPKPRSVRHLLVENNITTSAGQAKVLAELRAAGFDLEAKFRDRHRKLAIGIRSPDGRPAAAEWQDRSGLECLRDGANMAQPWRAPSSPPTIGKYP